MSSGTTASSSLTKRQRTTDDLLHWRRSQVVKLLATGYTIDQTAEKLQVSPKTVQRDYAYIRHHAYEVLRKYFVDTVPNEILKALARLTAVSDAAWAMAARAREEGNDKLEADALRLAKDTVKEITDIVTDNKPLIDAAYEAAYKQDDDKEQQQLRMNDSKESQEDDKKREEPIV
jgi:ParB-like chromosome segregation protein Spo0J